jgi:hypothetical protein
VGPRAVLDLYIYIYILTNVHTQMLHSEFIDMFVIHILTSQKMLDFTVMKIRQLFRERKVKYRFFAAAILLVTF